MGMKYKGTESKMYDVLDNIETDRQASEKDPTHTHTNITRQT